VTYQKCINHHTDVLVYLVLETPSISAKRNAANFRAFLPEITCTCLLSDFQSREREPVGMQVTAPDLEQSSMGKMLVLCD